MTVHRHPGFRPRASASVDVGGQGADDPEIAIALRIIESIPDHEFIGDIEAHIFGREGDAEGLGLAHQGQDFH